MEELTQNPDTSVTTPKRPALITFICVFSFIGALMALPAIVSSFGSDLGNGMPIYIAISTMIGLVGMFGLWKLRLWGLYLYIAITVLTQVVLISMGAWSVYGLIVPNLIIFTGFKYKKQLT